MKCLLYSTADKRPRVRFTSEPDSLFLMYFPSLGFDCSLCCSSFCQQYFRGTGAGNSNLCGGRSSSGVGRNMVKYAFAPPSASVVLSKGIEADNASLLHQLHKLQDTASLGYKIYNFVQYLSVVEVLIKILLEVATGVYYLHGLHGRCSSTNQPSGKSESSVIKPTNLRY